MNDTFMKEKPIFPLLVSMALPMVISMLVNALYNIVDSLFVAQISEDAMLFLENPEEELNMVDDCAPYVLTLVKGPIIVDLQELNFLSNCKIGSCQPEEKLSEDCIAKLKDLFFKK